jgi:ubiquinone/menaquinone biosynthesis C-methylase UbiE
MGWYRERILPWAIDRAMSRTFVEDQRLPVLAEASGRVLEIGFGTGASLASYPSLGVDHIVAIEPNVGMWHRARRRARRAGIAVELVDARAEAMPFPDGSFDTVVSNFTLCSISAVDRALSEVRRVLKPTGRFLFLEHGRSDNPRVARWQRRLNPIHGWYADGCRLDLPVDDVVRAAGLEIERLERYVPRSVLRPFLDMYRGIARPGGSTSPE